MMVHLGGEAPSWGLSRWNGNGLRFKPDDGEGFSLRGDKRQLLYQGSKEARKQGSKKSHRFTILGQDRFEYDCILNKEPDTNTVTLTIDGAERFDFFRQPDWLRDPFLAGSYVVYKKETLIGEGTGKLCHIYRPKIIDSRGRWVWGDLFVIGDRLTITIPEMWLAHAAYPVIVDPVIGTSTVGSQTQWEQEPGEGLVPLIFELCIPVNKFLVSETINGLCTAYAYTQWDDGEAGGRPVIYSDNGDKPQNNRTTQEGLFDFRVQSGKPAGWRSTTFRSDGSIAAGSNIWFGVFTEYYWLPRFDYGVRCFTN
jgi:hypothetical protein